MKAVILAGGRGSRLMPETENKPKCMTQLFEGRRIIDEIVGALTGAGVAEIFIVTGYRSVHLEVEYPDLHFIHNPNWEFTNVLGSLMCATSEMLGGAIISYADIVYERDTVRSLMSKNAEISVSVDPDWKKHYIGRSLHPVSQAEKVTIADGVVVEIGKHVPLEESDGEFIGLAYVGPCAVQSIIAGYQNALDNGANRPFFSSKSLTDAYFTDMLQYLISAGFDVVPSATGFWAEIDTMQDLKRVRKRFSKRE